MREMTGEPNRRILLIDDNRSIHKDFVKILRSDDVVEGLAENEKALFDDVAEPSCQMQYEVESAYQGQEGLEKVLEGLSNGRPYAMAFVDMRMPPGWDGLETITRLWQEDARLQIVICTAFSDYSWAEIVSQMGHRDQLLILKKPFDSAEVSQLAASLTEKWNLSRAAELKLNEMEQLVTERTKEIEQANRETESLLASISSLLIGVDASGVIYRWNGRAEEVFGITQAEALGRTFNDLDVEWDDPQAAAQFLSANESDAITRHTLKLMRDGSTRVLGASAYPVSDGGVGRGFLYLGTDITDHCRLEQQLRQAQKLEAVGQLAAGVAHEINTPMQYVGDNLDFLQSKLRKLQPVVENLENLLDVAEQTGDQCEFLTDMRANLKKLKVKSFVGQVSEAIDDSRDGVQHVSRIVRAMKEFAHPGQEEKTQVDVNRALESTIAVSTNEWKYVAEIETSLDESIPLIPALAGELNQVFLNILVNAAHAIGDTNEGGATGKGTITVTTRSTGNYIEVTIADSGTGMPDEIKQRIFDPFFTTKEIGKGTGQGLAIAHSVVVQKHEGVLRCDSSPGAGTTFIIQLPLEPSNGEVHHELETAIGV